MSKHRAIRAEHLTSLLILVWVLALSSPSRGAQPMELSLQQAVQIALERNHDVQFAREQLPRVDGEIQEVKSAVYPQVSLEADYFRVYDETNPFLPPGPGNSYAVKASANQLLFSWGKVSKAIEIAHDSRRRSQQDLDAVIRTVTLQVHEGFYELLLTQKLVEVAESTLALRKRQLDVAEKKFAAGVVNEYEVIRARVDVANAQPPVIRAKNQVRQSESRLNNLLSQDQGTALLASGRLEYLPLAELTLEEVVGRAITQRPELKSLQVAGDIAEKSIAVARAENKLQVNLLAEYGYAADQLPDLRSDREVWSAGVVFSMPLFDGWRTRGRVAQASIQQQEVSIRAAQLRQTITLEAKVVLDDLREAKEIIGAANLTINQAEKALELAETSYRYGVATALDVSNAELSLTVARTDYAKALHDYMQARARVLSVMNEL